jgi:hypothetical protein
VRETRNGRKSTQGGEVHTSLPCLNCWACFQMSVREGVRCQMSVGPGWSQRFGVAVDGPDSVKVWAWPLTAPVLQRAALGLAPEQSYGAVGKRRE